MKLSKRQQQIFNFIIDFTTESGYPPTVQEIRTACHISSNSVVTYNCNRLVEVGYLHKGEKGESRRYRPINLLAEMYQALQIQKATIAHLIGRVANAELTLERQRRKV